MVSYMLNANQIKHKFAFDAPKFGAFEDYNISKNYDIDREIEIENMIKMDKKELIKGLKKVWNEGKFEDEFDLQDLKDLCRKYNIDLYNVVDKKELELPSIGSFKLKNGAKQTFLMLDEEA